MTVEPLVTGAARASPSRRSRLGPGWSIATLLVVTVTSVPLVSLFGQLVAGGITRTIPSDRLAALLARTLALGVTVTITALALGMATAWLTTRTAIPGRRMWMVLAGLPLVIPSYVAALAIIGATGPGGLVQSIVDIEVPTPYGFIGAWLGLSLFLAPMAHLVLVPAFQRIDRTTEEAAAGLGAGRGRVLRSITIPLLRPGLVSAGLMISLYAISDFGAVSLLRYDTLTRAIYTLYQGQIDRRPAGTLALLLALVALGILWLERLARSRANYHSTRPTRTRELLRLGGGGTTGALIFLTSYVTLTLVVPIAVMAHWLRRGIAAGARLAPVLEELGRSMGIATAAAILVTLAAIPIAMWTVRSRSRLSEFPRGLAWSSYAIPHISVGVAVVTFALTTARPLYQTLGLLMLTYLAMFVAQSGGSIEDSLHRISPDLEDASRGLGHGAVASFLRITVPLLRPGMLAGAALVFLSVMKELPATLILRPNGFETLAVRIWSATGEGFYAQASLAGLTLLAVSILPLLAVIRRDLSN